MFFSFILILVKSVNQLNNKLANVRTYVGTDGKLHSVDGTGADTVLNFKNTFSDEMSLSCKINSSDLGITIPTWGHNIKISPITIVDNKYVHVYGSNDGTSFLENFGTIENELIIDIKSTGYKYLSLSGRPSGSSNAWIAIKIQWI